MDSREVSTSTVVLALIEWLGGDECNELDEAGLLAALGVRLLDFGLPIEGLTLHLRTIHPEIFGRSIAWTAEHGVEVRERQHGIETSSCFAVSPLRWVMENGLPRVIRPEHTDDLAWFNPGFTTRRGIAELVIVPLRDTAGGPSNAATFSTSQHGGFTQSERAVLRRIVPTLRNVCQLRALKRIELTVLETYVGARAAGQVLAGHIRRGEVEKLNAGLMLCDLRGFTALSNRLPGERVIQLLNAYFDRVVPAIADAGGEVIKFMGDAVLAIFDRGSPSASCLAALRSALAALHGLRQFNAPDAELHAGIALHYGEVAYGNIGSGLRLDFTVIGPDVNMVSRIQTVGSAMHRSVLMSERFALLVGAEAAEEIGSHELRGFATPVSLYSLAGRQMQSSIHERAGWQRTMPTHAGVCKDQPINSAHHHHA